MARTEQNVFLKRYIIIEYYRGAYYDENDDNSKTDGSKTKFSTHAVNDVSG